MRFIKDDGQSVRHALLPDQPVAYEGDEAKAQAIEYLQNAATQKMRHLAGVHRVSAMTMEEAIIRDRGGDVTAVNLFRQFQPAPKVKPKAHELDSLISDLEEAESPKIPRDRIQRLKMFAEDIRERDQTPPAQDELSPKARKAVAKLEALEDHLLHDDCEDVTRLLRVNLTKRQFLEGDSGAGFKMLESVLEAEKAVAAERQVKVAERQDELRREAAALNEYSDGLQPLPEQETEDTADVV